MNEIYSTPNMEIVKLFTDNVVTNSQLENVGSLENWEDVEKPTWGQGNGW